MKKFVLRVLAVLMVAAMMVPSMGNVSVALADEAVTLDLTQKGSVVSGEEPTANADGSLTFSGGVSMKYTFPLPEPLAAGETVKVNATIKFDSEADAGVRFYLINTFDNNIAEQIATVTNDGSGVVEQTFELKAVSEATELLFASSAYGVYLDNVTLLDITLGDKPAEVPAESDLVALNIADRVFVSGDAPADNADGSITFSGGTSMKCSFALPETLAAGENVTVNVKVKFDSEADAGIRFYLISNATDVNSATGIAPITNENTGAVVEQSFVLTAASDSTELLLASSSYGVYMDNVTVYEITLGEKPVVEEPVVEPEEPTVEPEEPTVEPEEPTIEVTGDEYVVKAGDTLNAIAKACGLSVKELVDANKIANPDLILVGAKLVIPTVDTTKRYVVAAGDTLNAIAKANGCTVADLVKANNIANADLIYIGQLILLP